VSSNKVAVSELLAFDCSCVHHLHSSSIAAIQPAQIQHFTAGLPATNGQVRRKTTFRMLLVMICEKDTDSCFWMPSMGVDLGQHLLA